MSLDELIKYNELVYGVKPKISKLSYEMKEGVPAFDFKENGLTESRLSNSYLYTGERFLLINDGRNPQVVATPGFIKGAAIIDVLSGTSLSSCFITPFDDIFVNNTPEVLKYEIVNVQKVPSFDVFLVEYDQTVKIW